MSYSCFELEIAERVAHVRLCRPDKRNTMIAAFWDELPALVRQIDDEASARVIVLSSSGPHFTAGIDVGLLSSVAGAGPADEMARRQQPAALYETIRHMQGTFSALDQCRLPVIAAVQGGCIGGGVDLVTACDIRLCSADAYFTIYEILVGLTADVGTFPRVCKLLPEGIVRELAYTGRRLEAEEALRLGFVNRVLEDHEATVAAALELAAEIAARPPLAVEGCKSMISYARDHSMEACLDRIALWNSARLQPAEIMESIAAGREGREGRFAEMPARRRQLSGD